MEDVYYNPAYTKPPRIVEQLGAGAGNDMMCDASIKTIIIPMGILEQLRENGIVADWLNEGEIEEILMAARCDGIVFDDPDGADLEDKLTLTEDEKRQGHGKHMLPAWYYIEKDKEEADRAQEFSL